MLYRLKNAAESIAAVLLLAAVALNFLNVVGRYAFGKPIVTTEEILQYCDVWIVMLAAAAVTYHGVHLRMDILLPRAHPRLYRALEIAIAILGIGITAFVCVQGWHILESTYQFGQRSVAASIPLVFVYVAIPLGFACMTVFLIRRLVRLLRGMPIEE